MDGKKEKGLPVKTRRIIAYIVFVLITILCKYNEASQHDSTTQVLYLRLREPYITYTKVRVSRPNIQVIQSYKPAAEVTCLSTDN